MLVDPPVPESCLVIVAHPDDAEFTAGGTVARWVRDGCRVAYCVVTSGDKGAADPALGAGEVAPVRVREQRAAAAVLGVTEITFLNHPDGALEPTLELRRDLVAVIRAVRPAAVVAPDPQRRYGPTSINHPDHVAVGEAALAAIFPAARDRLSFPELARAGLEPHRVCDVFLASPLTATVAVDISSTLEVKIRALLEHRSQVEEEQVRTWVLARAAAVGEPVGLAAAEIFVRITPP